MEKKEFKKELENILVQYGFHYINKAYYFENNEIIVAIATQKSNYENSYYINFGFLIKELSPNIKYPKDFDCDISGRFVLKYNKKKYNSVELDSISIENLSSSVKYFIDVNIKPVIENGLSKYLEINPEAVYVASLRAKNYLNIK